MRKRLYLRHGHFPHAGTVYLTSLLSGPWLLVNEKVKHYRSHRHHFPPLFHAYPFLPWISEANRILLRASNELSCSPARFRDSLAKASRSLPPRFARAEAMHLTQANF